jgi:soluble lytic murein transglycosylase-like protein
MYYPTVLGVAPRGRKPNIELSKRMATKWGKLFNVPASWLMTIADMESTHDPSKVNPAVVSKGGAWGLYQQMFNEVPYKMGIIVKFYGKDPEIKKTAKKWRGSGQDLLDPDLNAMITAWQLSRLRKIFGDNPTVIAAAYHQGENAVRRRVEAGKPPVGPEQPAGQVYVAKMMSTLPKYTGVV